MLALDVSSGPVPVCWRGEGIQERCTVFESGPHEVKLDRCPAWVYPNAGGTGYYRSVVAAAGLAGRLGELSGAERLTLVYDLRAMKYRGPLWDALASDSEPAIARAARLTMAGG